MWRGFFFLYPVTPTVWRMTVSRQKREAAALDCCTCSGLYQTTISGFLSFLLFIFFHFISLLRPVFSSQLPNNNNNNNKIRKWEKKGNRRRERERACPSSQFNYTHTHTNSYSIKMCIAAGWPNGVPPLAGHILYTCVTAIYALYAHTHTHTGRVLFLYTLMHIGEIGVATYFKGSPVWCVWARAAAGNRAKWAPPVLPVPISICIIYL